MRSPRLAGRGFQGGIATDYSGKKGTFLEGSTATLDLVGGKPALRLSGSTELIPIRLLTPISYAGPGFAGGASLQIIPVTAEGKLTLDSFSKTENGRLGNSHIQVAPALAAKFAHLSAFDGGAFVLGAQGRAGYALGVARDDDGSSKIFAPEVAGNVSALVQTGVHLFGIEANGSKIYSRQEKLDDKLSLGGSLLYGYGGLRLRAEATYDRVNVKPTTDGAQEKSDGKSLFVGGSAGFAW